MIKERRGRYYCPECNDQLPTYSFKAGQCSCGRCVWWYDDGGHNGIEIKKKSERTRGRTLERMVRPWS